MHNGKVHGLLEGSCRSGASCQDISTIPQSDILGELQVGTRINGGLIMNLSFKEPLPSDYETYEDYERAHDSWEAAMDDYCEEYLESRRGF